MKSAAIVMSGLGLFAAAHTASPASAAAHAPAAHGSHTAVASWWQPANSGPNNGPEWQWELDHPLRVANASDMGTGATNAAGFNKSGPKLLALVPPAKRAAWICFVALPTTSG